MLDKLLSDGEASHCYHSFVKELTALVHNARIIIDNRFTSKYLTKDGLIKQLVPNANSTIHDINHFKDLFILLLNNLVSCENARLKVLANFEKEAIELCFIIKVKSRKILSIILSKMSPKNIQEIFEHEVHKDLLLQTVWQFT